MYCKDCKYWKRNINYNYLEWNTKYGTCNHNKLDTDYDYHSEAESEKMLDKLVVQADGDYAIMQTGEMFGCVHFYKEE